MTKAAPADSKSTAAPEGTAARLPSPPSGDPARRTNPSRRAVVATLAAAALASAPAEAFQSKPAEADDPELAELVDRYRKLRSEIEAMDKRSEALQDVEFLPDPPAALNRRKADGLVKLDEQLAAAMDEQRKLKHAIGEAQPRSAAGLRMKARLVLEDDGWLDEHAILDEQMGKIALSIIRTVAA